MVFRIPNEELTMRATSSQAAIGEVHEAGSMMLYQSSQDDPLLRRARGEFREMPGMRLTIEQAMRLWDLDRQTCQSLLTLLVEAHFLEVDGHGRYRKAHSGY